MNITVIGDRSFSVEITIEFYDVRKLWRYVAKNDEVRVKEYSSDEQAQVTFTVVGRRPEEIRRITLEYDEHKIVLEPGESKFRDLGPIVIYDKNRDYWDIQLRQKALNCG